MFFFFCFVLSAVSETNNVSVGFTHNVLHYTGRFTVSVYKSLCKDVFLSLKTNEVVVEEKKYDFRI